MAWAPRPTRKEAAVKDSKPQPDEIPSEDLIVCSIRTPDGKYSAAISMGEKHLLTLNPVAARNYVAAFTTHIAHARYDAGVVAQLKESGIDEPAVSLMIREFRDLRGAPSPAFTKPIRVTPIVSASTYKPMLQCRVSGDEGWQWEAAEAAQHVRQVADVVEAARLDGVYFHCLREVVELDEPTARSMVSSLGQHLRQD
jgi:hypothetical protein